MRRTPFFLIDPDFAGGKRAEGLFLTQAFALVDGFRAKKSLGRHSGARRNPAARSAKIKNWIPAFAGMTLAAY
jgi:hypothetical protein